MAISAKDVMALRKKTGLGMMECKQALNDADGDMGKAVDTLRQKGLAKMDSRSDRDSSEGKVAASISEDSKKGALVQINTETDFTAGNEAFVNMTQKIADLVLTQEPGDAQKTDEIQGEIDEVRLVTKENIQFGQGTVLGSSDSKVGAYVHFTGKVGVLLEVSSDVSDELIKDICMHISAVSPAPLGITEDQVPEEILAKEREIAKAQAMESGKPENIAEKMVEGKIRKYYDQVTLLRQAFVKDDKKQIKDLLPQGAQIKNFVRYAVGG